VSRFRHGSFPGALSGDALVDREIYDTVIGVRKNAVAGPLGKPIDVARALYRNRRERNRHFDDSLFAEPGWDILLDLFIANEEDKSVSVSSACIGAAVPAATALRHLGMMQQKGLVERRAHPRDARCREVRITADAAASMRDLFASMACVLRPDDTRSGPSVFRIARLDRPG
jgi:hypothetical protein